MWAGHRSLICPTKVKQGKKYLNRLYPDVYEYDSTLQSTRSYLRRQVISPLTARPNWGELMIAFSKVTLNYPSHTTRLAGKPRLARTTPQKELWTSPWLMGNASRSARPRWGPECTFAGCSRPLSLSLSRSHTCSLFTSIIFLHWIFLLKTGMASHCAFRPSQNPPMLCSLGFFSSKSLVACIPLSKPRSLWQIFCIHPPRK